jgi:hypothetical protein
MQVVNGSAQSLCSSDLRWLDLGVCCKKEWCSDHILVCSCFAIDGNRGLGMRRSSNEVQHFHQIRAASEHSFKFLLLERSRLAKPMLKKLCASRKAIFDHPLLASYVVSAIRSHDFPKIRGTL